MKNLIFVFLLAGNLLADDWDRPSKYDFVPEYKKENQAAKYPTQDFRYMFPDPDPNHETIIIKDKVSPWDHLVRDPKRTRTIIIDDRRQGDDR